MAFEFDKVEKQSLIKQVAATGILDLSFRGLTEIPFFVWRLKRLRRLRLDHNDLEGEFSVPSDCQWPVLEVVDISHNRFSSLSSTICMLHSKKFKMLDVSFNKLCSIPHTAIVLVRNSGLIDQTWRQWFLRLYDGESRESLNQHLLAYKAKVICHHADTIILDSDSFWYGLPDLRINVCGNFFHELDELELTKMVTEKFKEQEKQREEDADTWLKRSKSMSNAVLETKDRRRKQQRELQEARDAKHAGKRSL
jgi:hypothetical protein